MRILIVDDEDLVLSLLRRFLVKWGHEVIAAENGSVAWQLFEQTPFPMVITDWMMPSLTGLDLIRRIRAHASGAHVYAVLLTGRAAKEDVASGMEAGANDFLAKPFDKEELLVRVREGERVMQREHARQQAEARCEHMQGLIVRCSQSAQHDLDEAVAILGKLRLNTKSECDEALAHLSSVRELMMSLRSDAERRPEDVS